MEMTIEEIIAHCDRQLSREPKGSIFYREHEAVKAFLMELQEFRNTGLEPEEIERLKGAIGEWEDGVCISQKHSLRIQQLQAELELLTENYQDKMEEYQGLGPIDHIRHLIQADKDETLIAQKVCGSCYYDDDHSNCPDGADSVECGLECFGCVCGECEGGSKFKLKKRWMGKAGGMSRPEVTESLSKALEKYLDPHNDPRIYWAKEVTFDYATAAPVRVDYMRFKPFNNTVSGIEKGDFYCYEIKSSVADFQSKNGHNFIGDYNYYVMQEDVFEAVKAQIPYNVGVLVPGVYGLQAVKKPHRKDRDRPVSEMLLMMWRSSRREVVKGRKEAALAGKGCEG